MENQVNIYSSSQTVPFDVDNIVNSIFGSFRNDFFYDYIKLFIIIIFIIFCIKIFSMFFSGRKA